MAKLALLSCKITSETVAQISAEFLAFPFLPKKPKEAMSSASVPFIFAPVDFGEKGLLVDNGFIVNMDFDSVVHQCRELVEDDS